MRENYNYKEIISEKLGNQYIQSVEYIKDIECKYCNKYKTGQCRLSIQNGKCINYSDSKVSKIEKKKKEKKTL